MKRIPPLLSVALMLCIAVSSFAATKSQQVEKYLGTYRFENDRPRGTVKYIFQKAVLKRVGNGAKTYKELLFDASYYSNEDNAGRLIGIQIVNGGRTLTIQPESPDRPVDVAEAEAQAPQQPERTPAPKADPVRPNPSGNSGANGRQFIPDSAAIVKNIDQAKQTVNTWKGRMWQTIKPTWAFIMWIFNSILVLLICFGGLCRYVAKTAASESLINSYGRIIVGRWVVSVHQNAAAMLLIISWIVAIVLLIDVFMWLVFLNLPVWTLVFIWFPILWVAEKITSWIVPDIRIVDTDHR